MKKDLLVTLAWVGGIVLLELGAVFAQKQGYIDRDMLLRIVFGTNGLLIAYYGNLLPKALALGVNDQQFKRVAGWSQVLSGLVYAGLWAFAPIRLAAIVGTGAVAAGVIVTLGYCFWLRAQARADA